MAVHERPSKFMVFNHVLLNGTMDLTMVSFRPCNAITFQKVHQDFELSSNVFTRNQGCQYISSYWLYPQWPYCPPSRLLLGWRNLRCYVQYSGSLLNVFWQPAKCLQIYIIIMSQIDNGICHLKM